MARTPTVERLLNHLFGENANDPLADEIGDWVGASPRFRDFLEGHRDKARKKLRGATDPDARRDVRAELHVASRLVADRRIGLEWEAYGSTGGGPDFTITYRSKPSFNLEVTRLRSADAAMVHGGPMLSKLRQLPPSVANALLVVVDEGPRIDPAAVSQTLRARADAKDEAFFARRGFRGSRDFYDRFRRLGAVIVWADAPAAAGVWLNRSARIAMPRDALRAAVATFVG